MNISQTIAFLSALKENNNKPWFDANRKWYEEVKNDWNKSVTQLIKSIAVFDVEIGSLEAKNCVFRINRDVRFSKDKSPYKTNFGAYFSKGGKKSKFGGYYVHLDPQECFVGVGIWMPEPPELQKIRQEIDYHFDEFKSIVEESGLKKVFGTLEGEKLSSVPKGYDKDNPAAEYLKYKSFIVSKTIDVKNMNESQFMDTVLKHFQTAKPLNDFLNKALDE